MGYTKISEIDFFTIDESEAKKLPPVAADDGAVTIHCYGRAERWNSRVVCTEFYRAGATACDGSESERYTKIYLGCMFGDKVPTDGDPLRRDSVEVASVA